jgi:hypothetical protein
MTACLNPATTPTAALPGTLSPSRYQPTGDDHLIFQWVKMEGKSQQTVASMFGIHQSTVSRIIQRYERWQAHLKDRENGRLDRAERLRAQRWLTYERNELMLASCLRIAGEMEGFTELSKSVTHYPTGQLSDGHKIRTEERVTDRHGVAARFLRLAYRINMDQLKLTDQIARESIDQEREAPAEPLPLSSEELAQELREAAEDAAEIAAARRRAEKSVGRTNSALESGIESSAEVQSPRSKVQGHVDATIVPTLDVGPGTLDSALSTQHTPAAPAAVHNLHHENSPPIDATPLEPCGCVVEVRLEKNAPCSCITDATNVGRSGPDRPEAEADSTFQTRHGVEHARLLVPQQAGP